ATITEVDLATEHQLAAGLEKPLLQRRTVVGGAGMEPAQPGMLRHQPLEERLGTVGGAVLGEEDLVVQPPGVEPRPELRQRRGEDALLVVDRNDHAQTRGAGHSALESAGGRAS